MSYGLFASFQCRIPRFSQIFIQFWWISAKFFTKKRLFRIFFPF